VSTRDPAIATVCAALVEPFDPAEVKWKPAVVKNNRCLAMAYIDARLIQDRLDDVVGVEGWEDRYAIVPDGSVVCRLRVKIGDRWITKTDVGSPSEQPDGGDRLKAAFSDALKRAAVKFGIGRYLYRLPAQWVDYDPVKKQITQVPQMPAHGRPCAKAPAKPAAQPAKQEPKPEPQQPKTAGVEQRADPTQAVSATTAGSDRPEPTTNSAKSAPSNNSPTDADPVANLDALHKLLKAKGKEWASAVKWLSQQTGAKYDPKVAWLEVPEHHRKLLVATVKPMPDHAPQEAK
jgi:hypothetical protein